MLCYPVQISIFEGELARRLKGNLPIPKDFFFLIYNTVYYHLLNIIWWSLSSSGMRWKCEIYAIQLEADASFTMRNKIIHQLCSSFCYVSTFIIDWRSTHRLYLLVSPPLTAVRTCGLHRLFPEYSSICILTQLWSNCRSCLCIYSL